MYNVYGDESYDEKKEKVFAVAGLFGSESEWSELKERWLGITNGKEVHATELESSDKEKYKRLVTALAESKIWGWGAVMSLEDYNKIYEQPTKNLPYYFCFAKVIEHFTQFTKLIIPKDRVHFTFDRNLQTQYNATFIYDYMVNLPEWKDDREFVTDEIAFSSLQNPKIQVADLWARELKKEGERRFYSNSLNIRPCFEALIRTQRLAADFYCKDYFENMKKQFIERGMPGHSLQEYNAWLKQKNKQDTTEHRIRYHIYLNMLEKRIQNMPKQSGEFKNFDNAMRELLKVPHNEIKRKLDEEKAAKKRKKSKKSSASGREGA